MNNKNIWIFVFAMFLCVGCGSNMDNSTEETHEWIEATCTSPSICSSCGIVNGEPLGHNWILATCTEPKKCSRCLITDGQALGHEWEDATCEQPKTCKKCGETEGKELGHSWISATCTNSKTCTICGKRQGTPLGHSYDYTILSEASCAESGFREGICSICGDGVVEVIPKTNEHDYGNWQIEKKASCSEEGREVSVCRICGDTKARSMDKLPHRDDEKWVVVVSATSQGAGEKATHCKDCGTKVQTKTYTLPSAEGIPVLKDTNSFSVLGAYTYKSYGYQYLIYVIKAKETTDAELKLVIKDKKGNVLDICEDQVALTKGKTNYFRLNTESKYISSENDYSMTTKRIDSYWKGAVDAAKVVQYNSSGKNFYVTVQQTKEDIGPFAQLKMLFFDGDKLVNAEECYYSVYAEDLEHKGDEAIMSIWIGNIKYSNVDFFYEDR